MAGKRLPNGDWVYIGMKETVEVDGEVVETRLRIYDDDTTIHVVEGMELFTVQTKVPMFGEAY